MNNNYNLQAPPPVYFPPYDRPPPYNPEYFQSHQSYHIPINNDQNIYPSQYYNQREKRSRENKYNDESCLFIFLGGICCCCCL